MKYVNGDICDTHIHDIIHGCNAQGVMGSGVAKSIRDKFPGCYEDYCMLLGPATNSYKDTWRALGMDCIHFVKNVGFNDGKPMRIHNLITQEFFGNKPNHKYASYYHVQVGIINIVRGVPSRYSRAGDEFAIPKIGCGLGGLKWEVMEELLTEIEEQTGAQFTVYSID